jgi:GT2 family glycosyltransferase
LTSIAIVTPWLNHLELADDYFEAVLPEMEEGDESIIVDNGSDPPLPFATVSPGVNLGYVGGCNAGLRKAKADAVLFLNNDVLLGERGWLASIRRVLEPGVLVGPLRNHPQASVNGVSFPYIDGWCIAGMRSDLENLGGFDLGLEEPAYYSDNLLCLRARLAGMTLREVRPRLVHLENVTAGRWDDPKVQVASAANRERYLTLARELVSAVH